MSEHRLSAIVSADVAGYSRRMAGDEDATVGAVGAARPAAEALAREHRGRLVDFTGDNFLAEFPSGVDAVRFALAFQGRDGADALPFRIGIHIGDVRPDGERIFGNGVNVAARLEALAPSGGICLSAVVCDQIRGKLDLELHDLGRQTLKNIPEPVRVLRVAGFGEGGARAGRRLLPWIGLAAAPVVAAMVALAWPAAGPEPPAAHPKRPLSPSAIAVLPFLDLSENADRDYLADGLTEEIISSLARNPNLRVVARTSVFAFQDARDDAREIGERLGVGTLLEGSVRTSGERLRVTAQLVRARDGFHVWTESYDRSLGDLFALQTEIASRIREAIEPALGADRGAIATSPAPAPDPRAYRAQLEARYHWNRRPEGLARAEALFREALEYDPGYAAAYAGLAAVHLSEWAYFSDLDRRDELLGQARHAIGEALFLDDRLALAYTALGTLRSLELRWAEAEEAFRHALALDPGDPETHYNLAMSLAFTGRLDEAREAIARALDLDPLSPIMLRHAGLFALFAGDPEAARELALRSLALKPGEFRALLLLARSHLALGNERAATEALVRSRSPWLRPLARIGLRLLGLRRVSSLDLAWNAMRSGRPCTTAPDGGAWVAAYVGDRALMMDCLNEAAELGRVTLLADPVFDPYRDLPQFHAYLERVGLPGAPGSGRFAPP